MPADVPREAAAFMETALERVYKSAAWRPFAERNMDENIWMGSAEYGRHLAERRVVVNEFYGDGIAAKCLPGLHQRRK